MARQVAPAPGMVGNTAPPADTAGCPTGRRRTRTAALLTLLAVHGAGPGASLPEQSCKVFLNATVGDGDSWGESFVDNVREGLLKSQLVLLASNADDAGLEVMIVTVRNGPNSTAVTRVITSVVRMRSPAEVPADKDEAKLSPHVALVVVRGPRLAIFKSANLKEGVASEVNILTGTSLLTACRKLSDHTFPAPTLPK